jgi:hypothetical protein
MRHWKARTTFGEKVADRIISDPRWQEQYPDLYKQLNSPDERFEAVLPEPMVLEMSKDGIYYYRASQDGQVLFCHGYVGEPPTKTGRFLSALEAIQEYGSECVFLATDKSWGYKGDVETFDEG